LHFLGATLASSRLGGECPARATKGKLWVDFFLSLSAQLYGRCFVQAVMKRSKAVFKYTFICLLIALLVFGAITTNFIFGRKAPIISGTVDYGIRYKNELKLDIYRPTKNVHSASPVVFYIHGGAWIRGSKSAINFARFNGAVNTLREQGYTIVCPDYTLAGKGRSVFPQCIADVYDAVEWTKENASVYGLDTTNLGILGESAGAHIAMMIVFSEMPLLPEHRKTRFNYLIDVYGPNDLTDIYHGRALERIEASMKKVSKIFGSEFNIKEYVFGFDPSKDSLRAKELLNKYSPINSVGENETPVLIIHGTRDQLVPVQQSMNLKQKLDSLGVPNEVHLLDSVDHNFINASQQQRDSMQLWISDFVVRNYRR
jgi:acetyl esterase/lipase